MAISLTKPAANSLDWAAAVNANWTAIENANNQNETDIAANAAAIPLVDRGDLAAYDFTQAVLVQNNAWHDIDISGIVPVKVNMAYVQLIIVHNVIARTGYIRTKGNANQINALVVSNQAANVGIGFTQFLKPDSNRKLQYKFTAPCNTILITVLGWTLNP